MLAMTKSIQHSLGFPIQGFFSDGFAQTRNAANNEKIMKYLSTQAFKSFMSIFHMTVISYFIREIEKTALIGIVSLNFLAIIQLK